MVICPAYKFKIWCLLTGSNYITFKKERNTENILKVAEGLESGPSIWATHCSAPLLRRVWWWNNTVECLKWHVILSIQNSMVSICVCHAVLVHLARTSVVAQMRESLSLSFCLGIQILGRIISVVGYNQIISWSLLCMSLVSFLKF